MTSYESLPSELAPGVVVGPYELVELLAQGGMGEVYRAVHTVTGTPRALKVVRPDLASLPDFRTRFVREATIASTVMHPNLVQTMDPFVDSGHLILPMELLFGETLWARLKSAGPLAPKTLVALLAPCCRAVHAVHQRNVIHRDLKPLNIFLAQVEGVEIPKVLDFGAARRVDDHAHTRPGDVIGSPYYMAPEQARGEQTIDERVDVYGMAAIAYHCLTGKRPYDAGTAQRTLEQLIRGAGFPAPSRLRSPSEFPMELEEAILQGLARDVAARTPSLAAFADALEQSLHASDFSSVENEATDVTSATRNEAGRAASARPAAITLRDTVPPPSARIPSTSIPSTSTPSAVAQQTPLDVARTMPIPGQVQEALPTAIVTTPPARRRAWMLGGVALFSAALVAVVWGAQRLGEADQVIAQTPTAPTPTPPAVEAPHPVTSVPSTPPETHVEPPREVEHALEVVAPVAPAPPAEAPVHHATDPVVRPAPRRRPGATTTGGATEAPATPELACGGETDRPCL